MSEFNGTNGHTPRPRVTKTVLFAVYDFHCDTGHGSVEVEREHLWPGQPLAGQEFHVDLDPLTDVTLVVEGTSVGLGGLYAADAVYVRFAPADLVDHYYETYDDTSVADRAVFVACVRALLAAGWRVSKGGEPCWARHRHGRLRPIALDDEDSEQRR